MEIDSEIERGLDCDEIGVGIDLEREGWIECRD